MSKSDDDVVVVGEGAQPPPPAIIYVRWSKVLKKYVPCDKEQGALIYKLSGD